MKIKNPPFEAYEKQIAELKAALKLSEDVKISLAYDGVHAVNELVRSVVGLHPHKRSFAVLGEPITPIKEVVRGLIAEGYNAQELKIDFFNLKESVFDSQWKQLKKDTLFVLGSLTEPFFALEFPLSWVRSRAQTQGVFSLFYGQAIPQNPWEGFVWDPLFQESHSYALVVKGDRCQGERVLWGESRFTQEGVELLQKTLLTSGKNNKTEDKELVLKFENEMTKKFSSFVKTLPTDVSRVWDRAVILAEGVHGEAACHELSKKGHEVLSANSCFLKTPHVNDWLPQLGFSKNLVECSLIFPLKTIQNPNLLIDCQNVFNSIKV